MREGWLDRMRRGLREHEDEREAVVAGDTDASAGGIPAADAAGGSAAGPGAPGAPGAPGPADAARTPSGGRRETPERIGPYRIVGELGRGGAGMVYVARSEALDRLVALKVLRHERELQPELRERFEVEARAAARLRHPNIVAVHDVGAEAGRRYLVMELIPGRSLAARLRDEGPLPPRIAARLIEKVALALEHAHARGILHRDLKPHNVLLDGPKPDAEPLLSDFGLAKLADAGASPTVSGQVMGTPAYMSPEQARGAHDWIDRRSDVWGLGATLHEALTGRPPVDGATALAVLRRLTDHEPIPSVASLAPGLPPDLVTIVGKALEKEPSDRYASAADLAADLRRFLADEPIAARPPGLVERARKWARRNPAQARALALAALVALVIGAVETARFLEHLRVETARTADGAREAAAQAERALARAQVAKDALRALVAAVDEELADLPGAPAHAVRQDLLGRALDGLTALRDAELAGADGPSAGAADAQRHIAALLDARARPAGDLDARARPAGDLDARARPAGDLAPVAAAWARAVEMARARVATLDASPSRASSPADDRAGSVADPAASAADPALAPAASAVTFADRDRHGLVVALAGLGDVERRRGDEPRARALLEEALVRARDLVAHLGPPPPSPGSPAAVDTRSTTAPIGTPAPIARDTSSTSAPIDSPAPRHGSTSTPIDSSAHASSAPIDSSARASSAPIDSSARAPSAPIDSSARASFAPIDSSAHAASAPIDSSAHAASAPIDAGVPASFTPIDPGAPQGVGIDDLSVDDLPVVARRALARVARALAAIDGAAGREGPADDRLRLAIEVGRELVRIRRASRDRALLVSDLTALAGRIASHDAKGAEALREEARHHAEPSRR